MSVAGEMFSHHHSAAIFRMFLHQISTKFRKRFFSKHGDAISIAYNSNLLKCIEISPVFCHSETRSWMRKHVIHHTQRNFFFLRIHWLRFFRKIFVAGRDYRSKYLRETIIQILIDFPQNLRDLAKHIVFLLRCNTACVHMIARGHFFSQHPDFSAGCMHQCQREIDGFVIPQKIRNKSTPELPPQHCCTRRHKPDMKQIFQPVRFLFGPGQLNVMIHVKHRIFKRSILFQFPFLEGSAHHIKITVSLQKIDFFLKLVIIDPQIIPVANGQIFSPSLLQSLIIIFTDSYIFFTQGATENLRILLLEFPNDCLRLIRGRIVRHQHFKAEIGLLPYNCLQRFPNELLMVVRAAQNAYRNVRLRHGSAVPQMLRINLLRCGAGKTALSVKICLGHTGLKQELHPKIRFGGMNVLPGLHRGGIMQLNGIFQCPFNFFPAVMLVLFPALCRFKHVVGIAANNVFQRKIGDLVLVAAEVDDILLQLKQFIGVGFQVIQENCLFARFTQPLEVGDQISAADFHAFAVPLAKHSIIMIVIIDQPAVLGTHVVHACKTDLRIRIH